MIEKCLGEVAYVKLPNGEIKLCQLYELQLHGAASKELVWNPVATYEETPIKIYDPNHEYQKEK